MDPSLQIPVCPLPQDGPNDSVPMLVVGAVFLLGSWLLARWKKKRRSGAGQDRRE